MNFIKVCENELTETSRGTGGFGSRGTTWFFLNFLVNKMIAIKVICCKHTMEDFYRMNKEFVVDMNIFFQCDCNAYGNHRMYFCVCCPCLKDLQEDESLYVLNNR